MRKYNSLRCIVLLLLALSLIIVSFKGSVYSTTDTSGISLESNPRGIAINPITNIAVIANEKSDSASIVDLNTQSVLSAIPVGKAPRGVAIDRGLNLCPVHQSARGFLLISVSKTHRIIRLAEIFFLKPPLFFYMTAANFEFSASSSQ